MKSAISMAEPLSQPLSMDALIRQANRAKSYPGTQQNLYSYSTLAWSNYMDKLAAFTAQSAGFTEELAEDALAAIAAARLLPSYESLRSDHVAARNDLIKLTQPLMDDWADLKTYIGKAFSPVNVPAMLVAAGADYYGSLNDKSWEGVDTFIRMVNVFLVEKSAALLANNNMPAGFPTSFATAADAFLAQRSVFLMKEKTAREGVTAKYNANEAIYASLVTMTEAGRAIYRVNPEERRNFTIAQLMREIRGNHPSGLKGTITTGTMPVVPVANALVFDRNDPTRFVLTAADGSYELRIPSGPQLVRVEAEGFVPQDYGRKIDVGTMHRKSFSLEEVPVAAAVQMDAPAAVPSDTPSELLSKAIDSMSNGVGSPV